MESTIKNCIAMTMLVSLAAGIVVAQSPAPQVPLVPRSKIQIEAVVGQSLGATRYEMSALAPDPRNPQALP